MKNIPVVVNEDKWTVRCPNQTVVDDNLLSTRKVKTRRKVDEVKIKSSPILSTKRTRSGRLVVPKKYDDQIVLFDDVDKDLSNGGNKSDMTNVENFEFVTNNTSDPDEKQKCETIGKLCCKPKVSVTEIIYLGVALNKLLNYFHCCHIWFQR